MPIARNGHYRNTPCVTRSCTVDLAVDLAAPRTARHLLRLLLAQWGICDEDVVGDAVLVVSELVTNACVHAEATGGALTIGVEAGDELVVWVADAHPGVPAQRSGGLDAESGRGLEILSQLAVRWAVEPRDAGKRVVAALQLQAQRCA